MRLIRTLYQLSVAIILLSSCQREDSFETAATSAGTLKSVSGNCLGSSVSGIFKAGSLLTSANSIDIQADVTGTGSYRIVSDTINGFSFSAEGNFNSTGIHTIHLLAKGTPKSATTNNFNIRYGATTCAIAVTTVAENVVPAVYTYATATDGACSGAVVSGDFKAGAAVGIANTVKLGVNVTAVGSYTITTTAVNGLSFSATGMFVNTGIQYVTLTATGSPVTSGTFNITAGTGSSSCTFTVAVTPGATAAIYTLGGTGSNCTGFTLAGSYTSGTAMTAANTAKMQVTVTATGTYTISTAAVNGVSFAASGTFVTTGLQTVTLTATGTPAAAGVKTFVVSAGTATCNFDITFAQVAAPAVFTLSGSPGACNNAVVNGIYQVNSPLTTANTVVIKVDVTSAGPYTITTNAVNGIQFSATGVFIAAATGISVTLQGFGAPVAAGTSTLSPAVGNTNCTFDIVVTAAPAGIFNCKIDGVYTSFYNRAHAEVFDNLTGTPVPYLFLDGFTGEPNGNTVPQLQLFINMNDNSVVNPGTYDEQHFIPPGTYRIEIDCFLQNADQSFTIWNTSSNFLAPNPPFTIKITSRTATNIKGTFSGQLTNLLDGSTLRKVVTEGAFDLPIQ